MAEAAALTTGRVKTGIQLIDERLGGGFDRPSTLLFFSRTPTEKRVFAEHFTATGLREGERCLYVDFYRAPQLAAREISRYGSADQDNLVVVDATSAQLLIEGDGKYVIRNLDDLKEIAATIRRAIQETRPARVVIDSLEFLADRFPREAILSEWRKIIETGQSCGAAVAFLFINWTYGEEEIQQVQGLCDYVVEFQSRVRAGVIQNFLRIADQREGGLHTAWIPYTFRDMAGLSIYFPRILVIGPGDAGKSTVVRALCGKSLSIDKMGTTVAFDYGNVDMSGIEAEVIGTPGQERFEFLFRIFAQEITGLFLVLDGSRPEDLPRARHLLGLFSPDTPRVVLANKADLPQALSETEIREALGLDATTPVLRTIATDGTGVREAMLVLAEQIMGV